MTCHITTAKKAWDSSRSQVVLRICRSQNEATSAGGWMARSCPKCCGTDIHYSRRRGVFEHLVLPLCLLRPFRCHSCFRRHYGFFWLRSRAIPGQWREKRAKAPTQREGVPPPRSGRAAWRLSRREPLLRSSQGTARQRAALPEEPGELAYRVPPPKIRNCVLCFFRFIIEFRAGRGERMKCQF